MEEEIKTIYNTFISKNSPNKIITTKDSKYINVNKFGHLDFEILSHFRFLFDVNGRKIIQIIGDSFLYSAEGTKAIYEILDKFTLSGGYVLEYGYTGYQKGDQCCINGVVNRLLDTRNVDAIANVVGQTYIALKEWKCTGSKKAKNFIMVVGNELGTYNMSKFGDDIEVSDKLCDGMICFEGDIQCFAQIVNCLKYNKTVYISDGHRTSERAKHFSIATFLKRIIAAHPSDKCIMKIIFEYFKDVDKLWCDTDNDADTKNHLCEYAFTEFITNKLYKKLYLIKTFS